MSLFQDDTAKIKACIEVFNRLERSDKGVVASDLNQVHSNEELSKRLMPLLLAIRFDISKHDETSIANRLFKLGMDEDFATLLVKTVIRQARTPQYDMKILSDIDDELFKSLIPELMRDVWVGQKKPEDITSERSVSEQMLNSFANATRYCMGKLSKKKWDKNKLLLFCKDCGLSDTQASALSDTLNMYLKFWFDMVVYSDVEETRIRIRRLENTTEEILETLGDILEILKNRKDSGAEGY